MLASLLVSPLVLPTADSFHRSNRQAERAAVAGDFMAAMSGVAAQIPMVLDDPETNAVADAYVRCCALRLLPATCCVY